jgi:hypothetical protein
MRREHLARNLLPLGHLFRDSEPFSRSVSAGEVDLPPAGEVHDFIIAVLAVPYFTRTL